MSGNATTGTAGGADNVIAFIRLLSTRPDLLERLSPLPKSEVLEQAAALGLPFAEADFDPLVWGLEIKLAEWREEAFDGNFPLWRTMWGRTYLEYLVADLLPAFEETGLVR
ncbi:hypothetical protein [Actinospica robiniae]|uniref:hypothetical protein n=1 Tax=Actinospica robiniae TaxID=304901 RepID=UPI00040F6A27|nr:hypothetical protein [Actinospica robiniae]